jgi:hypothetical protein
MESKTEKISLISLILGIIFVFFDSPMWYWAIIFISVAIVLPLIKKIWVIAGWASDKIERL